MSEDGPLTRDDAPPKSDPRTSVPKAGSATRGRARRSRAPKLPVPVEPAARSPWPAVGLPADERHSSAHPEGPAAGDTPAPPPPPGPVAAKRESRWFRPSVINVKTVYATFLVSLAVPPAALIGLLIAWEGSKSSPAPWLATHYTYQLRTFWGGLALNVVAWTLFFTGVGLLLYPLIAAWVVARSVKGIARVATGEPIEDPHAVFV